MKRLLFLFLLLPACSKGQIISTIAGNGVQGYSGNGEPATAAELFDPVFVKVNDSGYLFFADLGNNVIRKISPQGIISTFAGNGTAGDSGDGGPATDAMLENPGGVAFDKHGNVYIADWYGNRIRKVNPAGIITTIAGNGVAGYSGDGGPADSAELNGPTDVALDTLGNLYISDHYNNVIRKIDTSGIITTFAGNGYGAGMYFGGYSGDGGLADSAEFHFPFDLCFDAHENLYIADALNNVIRKINTAGIISTIAGNHLEAYSGDNGPATAAALWGPTALTIDSISNMFITDGDNNRIRKVDTSDIITTIAGNGTAGFSGDNGLATNAILSYPEGVAIDHSGNIYIADSYNNRIRCIGCLPTTGVSELAAPATTITIYPNPATAILIIQSANQPINQINITNLMGQTVYSNGYAAQQVSVNIADLPAGVYFVKVNGSVVRKFIKE